MTDTVNQLLSKAMSTTSEDEAIACLRMARKKAGGKFTRLDETPNTDAASIKHWERQAKEYYNLWYSVKDQHRRAVEYINTIREERNYAIKLQRIFIAASVVLGVSLIVAILYIANIEYPSCWLF